MASQGHNELILCFREVEWIDDYFTPASEHASQGKCDVEAQRCREQGNNKFKVKKYEEALQFYTKVVVCLFTYWAQNLNQYLLA